MLGMADTIVVTAILNHHRTAVKIPTRSFLMDFGLVGASVFVLACLGQPQSESWVATVQRDDGTTQSIRVDHEAIRADRQAIRADHQGDDVELVRQSILSELVPPGSEKRGLARWQSETSRFYAQADSQRMDSPIADNSQEEKRVFQTAAFQAGSDAGKGIAASAEKWIEYWNRRGDQSASWLSDYNDFHQQRVMQISESLVVAPVGTFLPAGKGLWMAIVTAVCVVGVGMLWCVWIPRRMLPGQAGLMGLATSADVVDPTSEPAVMSFRSSWVRLKQPLAVQARRVFGWMIVLSAMVAIGARLL